MFSFRLTALLPALLATAAAIAQFPFTYQGRLTDDGQPANGPFNMTFTLYGAPSGGAAIGGPVVLNNVPVTAGLFSVQLNSNNEFGAAAFDGDARWLEIAVNGATLTPRSPVSATPYAMKVPGIDGHSLDADGGAVADVVAVDAAGVVDVGLIPNFGAAALDQINASFNNSGVSAGGRWQSFQPAITGQLSSIRIRVNNFGTPFGTMSVELRAGAGAGGAILGTTSAQPPTGTNWVTFNFPSIPVTASQSYTWRISGAASHLLSSADFNPYPRGQCDLGANIDLMFETYVRPYAPVTVMSVLPNGRVGIGTDAPAEALSVAGRIEASQGVKFADGTTQTTAAPDPLWDENAGDVYVLGSYVGIGTSDPQDPLHITTDLSPRIQFEDTSAGGKRFTLGSQSTDDSFVLRNVTDSRNLLYVASNGFVGINTSAAPSAPLTLNTATGGAANVMSISANATNRWLVNLEASDELRFRAANLNDWTVAFGATNSNALTVRGHTSIQNGNLMVGGQTTTSILHITGGSDIAEPFNVCVKGTGSGEQGTDGPAIEPGMVVAIDPERVGELRLSGKAYDTAVAGIISGAGGVNPGMVLTQSGSIADGRHPVAMTGRVWCWVDADQGGPVKPGDLLTTSDTPGHAMKAADRERAGGATIGKAMSPLEHGRGLVLVLVNLQ